MIDECSRTLLKRVEGLERQNQRLRRTLWLSVCVFAGAFVLTGQTPSKRIVEAEQFVLRDSSGKARAELTMLDSGPSLTFRDSQGTARVAMALGPEGPGLVLA